MEDMYEIEMQAEETVQEAPKRVYIEFPGEAVTLRTNSQGEEFFSIRLPEGTMVAGEDFGGWSFTQNKVFPSKYREGKMVVSFPNEAWEISLSHAWKDADGEFQREVVRVTAGALREASLS